MGLSPDEATLQSVTPERLEMELNCLYHSLSIARRSREAMEGFRGNIPTLDYLEAKIARDGAVSNARLHLEMLESLGYPLDTVLTGMVRAEIPNA